MKMKGKIFIFLLAFAMLFAAAGCSKEPVPVNASTELTSRQTENSTAAETETTEKAQKTEKMTATSSPTTTKKPKTTVTKPTTTTVPTTKPVTTTAFSTTKKPVTTTEKKTVTTTAKVTEKPKKQSDKFTIKLYTDMNSKSYKALKKPEISFKTNIGGLYSDEYMRFVCDTDGVEVTLVELSYNDFRGEFDEGDTVFSIRTKKGVVYEFKAYLGETMPPAKLKAKKGGYGAEFVLQMNGKDARTDFLIKSAKIPK